VACFLSIPSTPDHLRKSTELDDYQQFARVLRNTDRLPRDPNRSLRNDKIRPAEKKEESPSYHKVVGEAFVDGLMHYDGSLGDDIASGQITP
jgi:hypothetical protein